MIDIYKIAEERALTNIPERVKLVINRDIPINKALDFVFESFPKSYRDRYESLVKDVLLGRISLNTFYKIYSLKHRNPLTPSMKNFLESFSKTIKDKELRKLFINTFKDAWAKAIFRANDNTFYVITGDIPAMWLRDSSLQVFPYLRFSRTDEAVRKVIEGVIIRQFKSILRDPYAYAFYEDYSVRRRKYSLDSLIYPVWLLYHYYLISKRKLVDSYVRKGFDKIISILLIEQNHEELSQYSAIKNFSPNDKVRGLLKKENPVRFTGMIWSGFRPSDDPCIYNFNIPLNLFALQGLKYMRKMYKSFFKEEKKEINQLIRDISKGIRSYGVINHENFGKIYAYEVDGLNNYLLMDDANPPSLLSLPFFNVKTKYYENTRKFVLSSYNPFFVKGKILKGVGSPHREGVWIISLILQALTTNDEKEFLYLLRQIKKSHANTFLIHESVNPNNPRIFTRKWFSMGNSLFAELIIRKLFK